MMMAVRALLQSQASGACGTQPACMHSAPHLLGTNFASNKLDKVVIADGQSKVWFETFGGWPFANRAGACFGPKVKRPLLAVYLEENKAL